MYAQLYHNLVSALKFDLSSLYCTTILFQYSQMTNILRSLFYLSVCITLGVSCNSDVQEASRSEKERTYGKWLLSEAQKDGKITKTLKGATFTIDSTSLRTNLFGDDQSFGYDRSGNKITLQGDQTQMFSISKSTSDTLILGMKRKRKQFELLLVKDTTTVVR